MNKKPIGVAVFGGRGRMGQTLRECLDVHPRLQPRAVLEQGYSTEPLKDCDVAIDFTVPVAAGPHAEACAALGVALVIGTTGLTPDHEAMLKTAAARIPIVYSANMSIGVNLLAALVEQAAARLGPEFDIEIAELHHNRKVDTPSGTALMLGHVAATGRGRSFEELRAAPRDGITGPRPSGEIGFSSLRGGDVAGEHTVYFIGEAERLELTHRAGNRLIFANGALRAAEWVAGRKPGLYSMRDVLEMGS
jgi:4-hydroxy-tetrahydrodipicolinate reductase